MTYKEHLTGTDRISEAVNSIKTKADYFVNIQGDEPLINPNAIKSVALGIINCNNMQVQAINAYTRIYNNSDIVNQNVVKVVVDTKYSNALSYSRSVNFPLEDKNISFFRQMGLYSFRRSGLSVFSSLKPKEKEIKEKVEMYRLLENGFTVRMIEVKDDSISVDTIEDLLQIRKVFYESKNNN